MKEGCGPAGGGGGGGAGAGAGDGDGCSCGGRELGRERLEGAILEPALGFSVPLPLPRPLPRPRAAPLPMAESFLYFDSIMEDAFKRCG